MISDHISDSDVCLLSSPRWTGRAASPFLTLSHQG
jgi:hypothetical protein